MKVTKGMRVLALLLAMTICVSFTGCGTNSMPPLQDETTQESDEMYEETVDLVDEITPPKDEITSPTEETTSPKVEENEHELTEQQKNSFSMLYHLAIIAEEIRISKDNRLLLDDIYTSLLNDINPGAIDETTQEHLKNMRDIIKSYLDISVKRERLQYIYNQDKASSIRSAVPNPLAILSVTHSLDWKKLATSVVYTVVDSYNNYKQANDSADRAFLLSGWELDDEETEAIQKNRERAFDYMVDIVQEYELDGKLTLNEKAIETFAEICAIESVPQKLHRLESEHDTYELLGNYWLELAGCYYETEQYEKCLECVDRYNELSTGIYRKDYNYVRILPKAIIAAQETYKGVTYVSKIKLFADAIVDNTDTDEWSVRYFAAQTYLDLYAKTKNREYLQEAYKIALDNVTILLDEQRKLNTTYLEDVKESVIQEPDYRFLDKDEKKKAKREYKQEQKRLKDYNEALKNTRKTELPSLYEPLVLNCDMLFALANELNISDAEKNNIEDILQTETNGTFLSEPINYHYSFHETPEEYKIDFSEDELVIPVNLLTTGAKVIVSVTDNDNTVTFEDCIVEKVERVGTTIDSFLAYLSSDELKEYEWTQDSTVTVKIMNSDRNDPIVFEYKVAEIAHKLFFTKVEFEQV